MDSYVILNAKEADRSMILRKFNYLTAISEKVKYAESKVHDIVPKRIACPVFDSVKNNKQSFQLRTKGHRDRKESRYGESLLMYNRSICYAKPKSAQLASGYASRSSVYLELKMYRLCLENIRLARDIGYPLKLMDELNATESTCLMQMKEMNDVEIDRLSLELSFPAHPKIPFIANCLELHENNRFGRYVTTNVDVAVGQLVSIEESYTAVLNKSLQYERCANCLLENEFSLIPCETCVRTMFCSQRCLTEAQQNYHRIECPIIEMLDNEWNDIDWVTIRTCIRAIISFSQLDELQRFLNDAETDRINAFTLNYCDNMPSSELYKAIHNLQTNQDKRSTQELFDIAAVTAMFCDILLNDTPLYETINSEKKENLLMELIFRQIQIATVNKNSLENKRFELFNSEATWNLFFNETKWKPIFNKLFNNNPDNSPAVYGNARFALCSLINHSCVPNVIQIFYGRHSATFAIRPIKAGEQLFLKYEGIGPLTHKLNDRQEQISREFFFKCECEACQNDYPLLLDLKCDPRIKKDFDPSAILLTTDVEFAKRFVSSMGPVLNKHDDDVVTTRLDVILYQEMYHLCLKTVYSYPPFRVRGNKAFEERKSLERQNEIRIRDQKILESSEPSERLEHSSCCFGWMRNLFKK